MKTSLALASSILAGVVWTSAAQAPAQRTIWDGVYTEAQAARGEQAYKLSCGYCHKDNLAGGFFDDGNGRAPALAGPRAFDSSFEKRWSGVTVGEMVIDIGTAMPQKDPGSLAPETYVDIVSFLLSRNGAPSGPAELPADLEVLRAIRISSKP
jgi:S-disulfanyl-L-cysteine oxidoreductase SoxD